MSRQIHAHVHPERSLLELLDVCALVPGAAYSFRVSGLPPGLADPVLELYGGSDSDSLDDAAVRLSPVPCRPGLYDAASPVAAPGARGRPPSVFCRVADGGDVYASCALPAEETPDSWGEGRADRT